MSADQHKTMQNLMKLVRDELYGKLELTNDTQIRKLSKRVATSYALDRIQNYSRGSLNELIDDYFELEKIHTEISRKESAITEFKLEKDNRLVGYALLCKDERSLETYIKEVRNRKFTPRRWTIITCKGAKKVGRDFRASKMLTFKDIANRVVLIAVTLELLNTYMMNSRYIAGFRDEIFEKVSNIFSTDVRYVRMLLDSYGNLN